MGLYEHWPYTNFHELNLDWIVKEMKDMTVRIENYVAELGIKYADPFDWDITHQYEQNTLVIEPISGTAYLSLQPVPSGIDITNTTYWTPVFTLGDLIEGMREGVAPSIEESGFATRNYSKGELIWVDKYLIIATSDIASGSAFSTGGNCESISIEALLNDLRTSFTDDITDLQNADLGLQNAIDAEIQDRKDADLALQGDIDDEILDRTNADTDLRNYVDDKLANIVYFPTPELFGAVGDGITDDTQAFKDMAVFASNAPGGVFLPNKSYMLIEDVFGNAETVKNLATFPGKKYIGRNDDKVIFSASNVIPVKTINRPSGYSVQALCADGSGNYYVGYASSDNENQIIYKMDSSLSIIGTCNLSVSALHLNTLTYNSKTNKLYTIESAGFNLIDINFSAETVSTAHTFDHFNAGIQYDPVNDIYVGLTGPNITNTNEWIYYIYASDFDLIKTGKFINPYGGGSGETPNGFNAFDGKILASSFNETDVQLGVSLKQYMVSADYFGNVNNVYEEYLPTHEYEGVAFYNGVYLTASDISANATQFTEIIPEVAASPALKEMSGRTRILPSWDSTYVNSSDYIFYMADTINRVIYISGYLQMNASSYTSNVETKIGEVPDDYKPIGNRNIVLQAAQGTANIHVVQTGRDIKLTSNTPGSTYINLSGCYQY